MPRHTSYASAYGAGISYGPQFASRLLCYPSSSLRVALKSSRGWTKTLGLCTHVEDLGDPGFSSAPL